MGNQVMSTQPEYYGVSNPQSIGLLPNTLDVLCAFIRGRLALLDHIKFSPHA